MDLLLNSYEYFLCMVISIRWSRDNNLGGKYFIEKDGVFETELDDGLSIFLREK